MRVISLDIGTIRTGFAFGETDLGLALTRDNIILTSNLIPFLEREYYSNPYSLIVIGIPTNRNDGNTDVTNFVQNLALKIKEKFNHVEIEFVNERGTSKIAAKNLKFLDKKNEHTRLDNESARILLQEWIERNHTK